MKLYLCEKPSQADDLAAVLGASQRANGYLHNGRGLYVTWAYGHLLEMLMPDEYDARYKAWSLDTLPIMPDSWRYKVRKSSAAQYKVVEGLIQKSSIVYIATDFDREGEAIGRSILDRVRYSGPLKRVCLRALDDKSIRTALAEVMDGSESVPLYYEALARQRADWLIGMNFSRLYTMLARAIGFNDTLHIGRVITPTVALVCDRDNAIAAFTPSPFWILNTTVHVQNGQFNARWIPPVEFRDEDGRCINKPFAEQVLAQVKGAQATIQRAETKAGKQSAPLPFDLSSLQQYAAKRWGYTAQQTLDGAQALYEKHKATTYPRADCRYLPDSQASDVPGILQSLILSDPNVSGLVAGADPARKSRAFNTKKVKAHHAIIPTAARANINAMSEIERNLYDAIRRFYIAQFYSDFEFNRTTVEVLCGQHIFSAVGKVPTRQGWKVLFNSDAESEPADSADYDESSPEGTLPQISQGEPAMINDASIEDKVTRPPPHFTEAALLAAMENIARFVSEEKFKQILKETAGLGTVATRAGIIEGAIERGYLKRTKKIIQATPKAHSLMTILPEVLRSPGMTAAWEQQLEKIGAGELSMSVFMTQISNWVAGMVDRLKAGAAELTQSEGALAAAFANAKPATFECFTCGGSLKRVSGQFGFFWGCQNRACNNTFKDNRGKPVDPTAVPKNAPKCPECEATMVKRKGKPKDGGKARSFWGCSNYPTCKGIKKATKRRSKSSG